MKMSRLIIYKDIGINDFKRHDLVISGENPRVSVKTRL